VVLAATPRNEDGSGAGQEEYASAKKESAQLHASRRHAFLRDRCTLCIIRSGPHLVVVRGDRGRRRVVVVVAICEDSGGAEREHRNECYEHGQGTCDVPAPHGYPFI
jgi:hypothetical protein